jgi:hypothetical protein
MLAAIRVLFSNLSTGLGSLATNVHLANNISWNCALLVQGKAHFWHTVANAAKKPALSLFKVQQKLLLPEQFKSRFIRNVGIYPVLYFIPHGGL